MRFVFDIDPVPASRPRVTRWGNRVYYEKTYERFRTEMGKLLRGKRLNPPISAPVKTDITFWIPIPKSYSKKKRAEIKGTHCVGISDIDNFEKALYDSLNDVTWDDDKQVVEHHTRKMWIDGRGKIEAIIETL